MDFKLALNLQGELFSIIRDGETTETVKGVRGHQHNKKCIKFLPTIDVQPKDWLEAKTTNEKFYVEDVGYTMGIKSHYCKNAYYLTQAELDKQKSQNSTTTFNIKNAENSIIGTQDYATLTNNFSDKALIDLVEKRCGDDKEQMLELLKVVNTVIENNTPIEKGLFSRFGDTASKYSWLLGAVTTKLIGHIFK